VKRFTLPRIFTPCCVGQKGNVRAASERGERRIDPGEFPVGSEGVEDRLGCIQQLPCRREIAGALAQCCPRDHRLGKIVACIDALENPYSGPTCFSASAGVSLARHSLINQCALPSWWR